MAFKVFVAGNTLTAAEVNDYLMEQANIVCTSGTRPSSPAEGWRIIETDTDKEYTYSGSGWVETGSYGGWSDWTPTITQSGSVTFTDTYSTYSKHGRTVHLAASLTITGTGTGANAISIGGLPFNAAGLSSPLVGVAEVQDSSASQSFYGFTRLGSASSLVFAAVNSNILNGVLGTHSFTAGLASGDVIKFNATYEATS